MSDSKVPKDIDVPEIGDRKLAFPHLPRDHPFAYNVVLQKPKEQPQVEVNGLSYEILHTGGFLRLYTYKGRVFWLVQNMDEHISADWKLHFSVHLDDIPIAWDIIAQLFMEKSCLFGMKSVMRYSVDPNQPAQPWPEVQKGREITVYIFKWLSHYSQRLAELQAPAEYTFSPADEKSSDWWYEFIRIAEERLKGAGVRSRGCADGDLPLGEYASLRNEAYCVVQQTDEKGVTRSVREYPPNDRGWNAERHPAPITLPFWQDIRWRITYRPLRAAIFFSALVSAIVVSSWAASFYS